MNQIATTDRSTMNSVAISTGANGSSLAPQSLADVVRFAEVMCRADIALPKHLRGNAGACMAVAMQALEWQMSPFAVASKSYAVNGAIAYEAQLIAAVVNTRSGIKGRLKYSFEGSGAEMTCTVVGTLDGEECSYTSPPIGTIPTKNSPLWKSDPQQQLGYFSARSWARRHCPEVILGVYDRDEAQQFQGPDNAKDITPSIMQRLQERQNSPQEDAGAREGFSADHVTRETDTLSGGPAIEQQTSSGAPSSDENGSGDPAPQDAAAGESSSQESGQSSEAGGDNAPASEPADPTWLSTFAKVMVAAIGPDEGDIVQVSKGLFKDGLTDDQRARARKIVDYCRQVARKEIERDDAVDIIAGIAGVEAGELAA
ncbi:recombinase RecT [Mesorhizobium sp. YIM 152430]|uniref:recombinase RecT n=1 Tax=Mesorhizobium sp. YIM 152430 TaxID=3031761 RepID=UPI0023D99692|nr:recombinase RecT [Mesorhizobium sp. YIM 152430]MDF1599675.1 recombinase RecT [Mesorhizobium sp. YIM 152430]